MGTAPPSPRGEAPPSLPAERIVSGGQTGADRAALDVALEFGLACGGWCPKGRRAEDGPIDPRYPLDETPSSAYPLRTEWNVRDSDATLILAPEEPAGGAALARRFAREYGRPCLRVDPGDPDAVESVRAWLRAHVVRVLNVAGPREQDCPGLYETAVAFLRRLLEQR